MSGEEVPFAKVWPKVEWDEDPHLTAPPLPE
uniref:Uncharacterized protein n=1 Tax=Anguilla anguilla TaxID=7936 RepID=A0A0E9TKM5_ANGAN